MEVSGHHHGRIGGWVGSRAGFDDTEKRKPFASVGIRTPDREAHALVTTLTGLSQLHSSDRLVRITYMTNDKY